MDAVIFRQNNIGKNVYTLSGIGKLKIQRYSYLDEVFAVVIEKPLELNCLKIDQAF